MPGVSGKTGPLSTTLEEHRRRKNKSDLKTGQRERGREDTTEGAEEEERLKVSFSSTRVAQEQLGG